ncbi:MAG: septation protein A [Proteobacteria bacterium]|nr:septation protein A [Pseudomonadota bacterium]MDE3207964.1 septation protein A [Pseudomonadota bacterium]
MKLLFDLFPIILFFLAYKFSGIYVATTVAILTTILQIIYMYVRYRKIEVMLWVSLFLVTVFGGATLIFHDETFIKIKPTILYWIMGGTLALSQFGLKKNLMQNLMKKQLELPQIAWQKLNLSWSIFFFILGAANWYVAIHYPTAIWVDFKLFGTLGLMVLFVIIQTAMLSRYVKEHE